MELDSIYETLHEFKNTYRNRKPNAFVVAEKALKSRIIICFSWNLVPFTGLFCNPVCEVKCFSVIKIGTFFSSMHCLKFLNDELL